MNLLGLNLPDTKPPKPEKNEVQENFSPVADFTRTWGAAALAVLGSVAHALSQKPENEPDLVKGGDDMEEEDEPDLVKGGDDMVEEEDDDQKDTGDEIKERRYTALGDIIKSQNYGDGTTMDEHTGSLIALFEKVFSAKKGYVLYFGAKGESYLEKEVPPNWYRDVPTGRTEKVNINAGKKKKKPKWVDRPIILKKMTDSQKNDWDNKNRKEIQIPDERKFLPKTYKQKGYPLVATPVLPNIRTSDGEKMSYFDLMLQRLNKQVVCPGEGTGEGPRHLNGKEMTLYDAIKTICDAYDIPWAIALGLAAKESGYEKMAESKATPPARGIFQIQPGAYEDAKAYAEKHPEYSKKVRKGNLLGYFDHFQGVTEWTNRLVQAEMVCAYFRLIQEQLAEDLEVLDKRLQILDPTYTFGSLSLIATITAYNGGPGRIKRCIQRFVNLNDEEMKKMIGNPPYGIDVWQAVLANSFGRVIKLDKKGNEVTDLVGPAVFTYAAGVLALGSLIIEEENILAVLSKKGQEHYEQKNGEPSEGEDSPAKQANQTGGSERLASKWPFKLSGFLAVAAGLVSGIQARQEYQEKGLTRRDVVKGIAALLGMGVPTGRAAISMAHDFLEKRKGEKEDEEPQEKPKDVNVLEMVSAGKLRLDALYDDLKVKGDYGRTTQEKNRLQNNPTRARVAAVKPFIQAAFGMEWDDYIDSARALPADFKDKERDSQMKNLKKMLATGEAIPMEADNPDLPYFCQGLGHENGIGNKPESMFIHKDFLPVLEAMVELVNHQIDLFNANPTAFGMMDEDFPPIAHISGVKVSGAFRPLDSVFSASTQSFSDHWTVLALDMISQGSGEGTAVFRFKEDQHETKEKAKILFHAGSKLPAQGRGPRLRDILIRMTEHALWTLEDVLKAKDGVKIMPRFEGPTTANNWHVTLVPPQPPSGLEESAKQ